MVNWIEVKQYEDITYHKADGMARIAFNRPEVRNAFRPQTIDEMIDAFRHVWMDQEVGVILLTGNGPAKMENMRFVPAAINGYGRMQVMLVGMACRVSMCWNCNGSSAPCPNL